MDLDWNLMLVDQLDWLWRNQTRPRLAGLTDAEYFWEPVADCWSVRRTGESTAPIAVGAGDYVLEFAHPEPDPPPVTTIAWRMVAVCSADSRCAACGYVGTVQGHGATAAGRRAGRLQERAYLLDRHA
jgi:hypothetical protein